jgi:hypothetical protein
LGNESLSLLLLASMHSRIFESTSASNSKSDRTRMPISTECLKFDVNIHYCASDPLRVTKSPTKISSTFTYTSPMYTFASWW